MLKILHRKGPTKQARALKTALELRGVKVYEEVDDGFKTVDLSLPKSRVDIEVDGIQHLTDPRQILADLNRGHFSHKDGYDTMHIPNEMLDLHLDRIADALAEASKIREKKIHVYMN
jgi:very-short-patch-repair endonuclease